METKPINKLLSIYKKHDNKNYQVFNILNDVVSYSHYKKTLLELFDCVDKDMEIGGTDKNLYNRGVSIATVEPKPYFHCLIGSKQVYRVLNNGNEFKTFDEVYGDKINCFNVIDPATLFNNNPPCNNEQPMDIVPQLFQFNALSKLNDFKEQNNYPKEFSSLYILNLVHVFQVLLPKIGGDNPDIYSYDYIKNLILFKSRGYLKGNVRELEDKGYLIVPIEGVEMDEVYLENNEVDYYYYLVEGIDETLAN